MGTSLLALILLLVLIAVMLYFNPNVDETNEGDLILWYGRTNRKYIFIWKN